MRINHNISAMSAMGALSKTNRELNVSLEKLSTGLRINRSSDDAAGLAISENLRSKIRGVSQAQRNAMDGTSLLQIAEGAANEISDILQRMRELAVQSSNDTLTSVERNYTHEEFSALRSEIDRIATVTNYNGMQLISSATSNRFGTNAATSSNVLWVDAGSTIGSDSITLTVDTLTISSLSAGQTGTQALSSATLTSQSNATDAIRALDVALNSVNTARANVGAFVNRLEHAINNLVVSETNQSAAESLIRDADFAQETAKFTRGQILMQSGMAMLAQSNMVPQNVLGLIQG